MLQRHIEIPVERDGPSPAAGACRQSACTQNCRFFFDSVPAAKLERAAGLRFARNETIYAKGDKALHAYKVLEGAVRLSRVYADGRRQIVNFHSPGETFGLEFGACHAATAEAASETLLLRCPRVCVMGLANADPEINRRRMLMLSKSLDSAERHIAMLGHQSARQRIASFFLSFETKLGRDGSLGFELPLGRQDVADYLGLTIETTCRALSDLKRRRIVDAPSRRQIVIHDAAALHAIAEGLAA